MSTKWCRFQRGDKVSYGRIDGDSVVEIEGAPWGAHKAGAGRYALSSVKLLIPTVPSTFYCVGINYREHIIASAKRRGVEPVFPDRPDVGYRANNALCAHEDPIVKPKDSGEAFQYEGELVAVIGKQGKKIPQEKALDHVFGSTIGNDVSERDWQKSDLQWFRAKAADTFGPLGPELVTGLAYDDLLLQTRLNGEVVQSQRTRDLIFDVATIVSYVSRYVTLEPGDVIYTGTPGTTRQMKPGDVVEVELEGVGVLRNPVVRRQ